MTTLTTTTAKNMQQSDYPPFLPTFKNCISEKSCPNIKIMQLNL